MSQLALDSLKHIEKLAVGMLWLLAFNIMYEYANLKWPYWCFECKHQTNENHKFHFSFTEQSQLICQVETHVHCAHSTHVPPRTSAAHIYVHIIRWCCVLWSMWPSIWKISKISCDSQWSPIYRKQHWTCDVFFFLFFFQVFDFTLFMNESEW